MWICCRCLQAANLPSCFCSQSFDGLEVGRESATERRRGRACRGIINSHEASPNDNNHGVLRTHADKVGCSSSGWYQCLMLCSTKRRHAFGGAVKTEGEDGGCHITVCTLDTVYGELTEQHVLHWGALECDSWSVFKLHFPSSAVLVLYCTLTS